MRDDGTGQATGGRSDEGSLGRALVVFERRRKPRVLARPAADFVTQLIACEHRIGAYRRSRRDEPGLHQAGYGQAGPADETRRLDKRV